MNIRGSKILNLNSHLESENAFFFPSALIQHCESCFSDLTNKQTKKKKQEK